jgi:hypothetical protein
MEGISVGVDFKRNGYASLPKTLDTQIREVDEVFFG